MANERDKTADDVLTALQGADAHRLVNAAQALRAAYASHNEKVQAFKKEAKAGADALALRESAIAKREADMGAREARATQKEKDLADSLLAHHGAAEEYQAAVAAFEQEVGAAKAGHQRREQELANAEAAFNSSSSQREAALRAREQDLEDAARQHSAAATQHAARVAKLRTALEDQDG